MRRVLQVTAIGWLIVAMLTTTAGLCLCRGRGPDSPTSQQTAGGCCHRHALAITAAGTSCCQIEQAPHAATSPDVVAVQPAIVSAPLVASEGRLAPLAALPPTCEYSPPIHMLRV